MGSELDKGIENLLRERVVKILKKDESGWTLQHTLRVVYWVKELIKEEGGNERILIPAAYLHDIGYTETDIGKREKMDGVYSKKMAHMILGRKICRDILSEFNHYFSEYEIRKICEYVGKHDLPELGKMEIDEHDFQLLFEADSLGSIDPSLEPTFSREDLKRYLRHFETVRKPLFKTNAGIRHLKEIYPKTLSKWLKQGN